MTNSKFKAILAKIKDRTLLEHASVEDIQHDIAAYIEGVIDSIEDDITYACSVPAVQPRSANGITTTQLLND